MSIRDIRFSIDPRPVQVASGRSAQRAFDKLRVAQRPESAAPPVATKQPEDHRARSSDGEDRTADLAVELAARYQQLLVTQQRPQPDGVALPAVSAADTAADDSFPANATISTARLGLNDLYHAQGDKLGEPAVTTERTVLASAAVMSALVERTTERDAGEGAEPTAALVETLSHSAAVMPIASGTGHFGREPDAEHERQRMSFAGQNDAAVAYRYGTLPVLVAGQLVELDLVRLQQGRAIAGTNGDRRLIMTLNTQSFGRVQVDARALGNQLTIKFAGQSVHPTRELATYAEQVGELVSRLGWTFEEIRWETEPGQSPARQHSGQQDLPSGKVDWVF